MSEPTEVEYDEPKPIAIAEHGDMTDIDDDDEGCLSVSPSGWLCTRSSDHDGVHMGGVGEMGDGVHVGVMAEWSAS